MTNRNVKRMNIKKLLRILLIMMFCCVWQTSFSASPDLSEGSLKKEDADKRFITIDFDNVDIRLFIKYMSELTGKNFVVDKSVQGNVTIISPTKISEEEAYKVFESVLEVHGFTTVQSGTVIKILPSAEARSKNVEMLYPNEKAQAEDKVVTQLIPLLHSSPEEMKKVLAPLVSQSSVLIGHTQSGMLIITETLSNLKRLNAIIEALDVEYTEEDIVVIPLKNSTAETLAKLLSTIYQRSSGGAQQGTSTQSQVKIVPYERVNSLVVMADSDEVSRIQALVELLDTEEHRGDGNIHVMYLENADSVELASVLNTLPGSQTGDEAKGQAPAISKNVKVMADEETNSLIITASKEEFNVLQGVIKKLDIPRQMVYLEALIMEVNTSKDFEVGVEWGGSGLFAADTGEIYTGFSEGSYSGLEGITADEPSLPASAFSFGVLRQGIEIGGTLFPNIGAVLKAYKTDSDINIISTPQILTTDNKKAEISVGENVPYITSKNTTSSEQDYTQYEYKDVATKLSITPQINFGNTLRLEIDTEIVKIKSGTDEDKPTTYKRTASTTVILNDQDTVVIGGIIGHDTSHAENKIPLLGDIPLLGWFFRSTSSDSRKTNMFIFVTPKIIRNPADIERVTLEKEDRLGEVLPTMQEELQRPVNKQHANILGEKGYHKLQRGRVNEAIDYFEEALASDPDNLYALYNMAVACEQIKDFGCAGRYYQEVIRHEVAVDSERDKSEEASSDASLFELAKENLMRIQRNDILAE